MVKTNNKYALKVYESQWNQTHSISIKPFFEILEDDLEKDSLFYSYHVFQNAESLKDSLSYYQRDRGLSEYKKIIYISSHGNKNDIEALQKISKTKLKNILLQTSSFYGIVFGTCEFGSLQTASLLLNSLSDLRFVAGTAKWVPWIEGSICDLLFFKLLLGGRFSRPNKRAKWIPIDSPREAALNLYEIYPLAINLGFSVYSRKHNGEIMSTMEECINNLKKGE